MKEQLKPISLAVTFEKKTDQNLNLRGFLFSRSGKLLETADIQKETLSFKTKVERPDDVRLVIAPIVEGKTINPSLDALLNLQKGHEVILKFNPEKGFHIRPIPETALVWWFRVRCHVRGNVSKFFTIHEITSKRSICNARVHICEVDRIRWIINRIPDRIIERIPDIILNPEIPLPIPFPEPDPLQFSNPQVKNIFAASDSIKNLKTADETFEMTKAISGDTLLAAQLQTRNVALIRSAILEKFHLFHPIFCYHPWLWHYFYTCQELAVVQTDMNGNFDTDIYYNLFGDHPDLYFWVEVLIDGVWTTVYRPSKPCNTYWNYVCGTQVNITVSDPRVQWGCQEILPGEVIWVKTVGHGASVSHIQQTNAYGIPFETTDSAGNPIPGQAVSLNRIGLTDFTQTTNNFRSPFGKNLYFIIQFGSGLPSSQYKYYRWSFQKVKNQDLSDAVAPIVTIGNTIEKGYTFEFTDVSGTHFDSRNFKLGPFSVGTESDLYLIPPTSPYAAPVNATETSAQWDQNTLSVVFDSNALQGDGLYELTLELFDNAGNKISNIPNNLFQVPDAISFAPSVNAPAINLVSNGVGVCSAFKMLMRIDNNICEAEIYKVKVNGIESSPSCCGFVKYHINDDVELSFRAFHPTNFADFNFVVQKGTCYDPIQSGVTNARGMVIVGTKGYARDIASRYRKSFTPAQLLGTCTAEGKAAFAEHLALAALATDGNRQLQEYNASALAAFALEPA
jgi:hypothetical protein